MIFDSPPRPRRRVIGRIIWPVLITAAVTLGLVVSAAGTETRIQIEYLSEIHNHAVNMSRNGEALAAVTHRLDTISRDEFVTVTDGIISDLVDALAFVEEDPPSEAVLPIRSLFRQTLVAWDRGVEAFSASILEASDHPNDLTVVDRISASLADLRAGDAVYLQLITDLERDDMPEPLSPLPAVTMAPGEGGLTNLAIGFSSAARSPNNTLTLRPGLRVSSVVADPTWQLDANEEAVLQTTESVIFSVVISNIGNVESVLQQLVLTLTGEDGSESLTLDVEPLRAGLQVTLIFDALEVVPGGAYEVTAELQGVVEDIDFTDNIRTVEFTVNAD